MNVTTRNDHPAMGAVGQLDDPASSPAHVARRRDLDWLRILAVLLLVPFHSALIFIPDPALVAYVKDPAPSTFLVVLKDFLDRWQLELLFYIAGAAAWFALGRRSNHRYLVERVQRLLVPLVFGLLIVVPLMINVQRLGRADAPSLGALYARFFTVNPADLTGMDGRFTPAHLWFILYLLLFSLVALPIFRLLQRPASQDIVAWLAGWPAMIYLVGIPLALARSVDLIGLGAKDPIYYLLLFLIGYILTSQPRFQQAIDRNLGLSLGLALAATVGPQLLPITALFRGATGDLVAQLLYRLSQWTWVLAVLAVGHRWLNRESRVVRYFHEAAYPFYFLHLPIDTLIATYVIQLNLTVMAKYWLLVAVTTLLTVAVYDLIVRRVGLLRFCLGLKPVAHVPRQWLGNRPIVR